ncbi:PREDICTED: GPI-anchor transamidase [Aptenodytes forsteri]|nr:PREDICTED: GPI-anchor transamidase [Aptenodytes forsteri]
MQSQCFLPPAGPVQGMEEVRLCKNRFKASSPGAGKAGGAPIRDYAPGVAQSGGTIPAKQPPSKRRERTKRGGNGGKAAAYRAAPRPEAGTRSTRRGTFPPSGMGISFSVFQDQAEQFFRSGHTNNWAVLVCTSRFWFNYRHVANTLSVYRSVKRLGIPDSHIVLMLADDMACNPRNPKPATVFSHKNMELNVYGDDVEVDYRSYEVTVENFLRVLTGRIPPSTPRSKRLLSDDRSNILIYMTGHGGNGFLKFQDSEEITNVELADAFEQMWQKRRYNELLFIIDTCQGASMYERFYSPNIMALASSQVGEDSLSHQPDLGIGVHLMDRYTFYVLEFLEEIHPASQTNMNDLFQVCPKSLCVSTPGHRTDLFQRDPQNVLITDFFGSVRKVEITTETISLDSDLAGFESKLPKDELATEPQKYAEQLPVAQIIHQKPKQKDWHPPGGFILGLWALIIMVFFKTYGIKHMKHVF